MRVVGRLRIAAATASSTAPRIPGRAALNSGQNTDSASRLSSGIVGNCRIRHRSNRSDRVATSSMPVRIVGRVALKMVSSSFSYSVRVANPPPVANRQSASDNHPATWLRLSVATTQPLLAAIARSLGSRGSHRTGASFGSIDGPHRPGRGCLGRSLFAV